MEEDMTIMEDTDAIPEELVPVFAELDREEEILKGYMDKVDAVIARIKELLDIIKNYSPDAEDTDPTGETDEVPAPDETYLKALYYCIQCGTVSVSLIQRRFSIGCSEARGIIDWMASSGYITAPGDMKPGKVLMTMEEFTATYGDMED